MAGPEYAGWRPITYRCERCSAKKLRAVWHIPFSGAWARHAPDWVRGAVR